MNRSPEDWAEGKNLAKENPEIVAKLSATLDAWRVTLPKEPAAEFISKNKRARGRAQKADTE